MPAAAVVVACTDLDANVAFFQRDVGLRVERVSPADDPSEVEMSGHGVRILLRRGAVDRPILLQLARDGTSVAHAPTTAPNGSRVEHVPRSTEPEVPGAVPSLSLVRAADGDAGVGRAGMRYRDLLPGRWGGRFIASHITIPGGGEVADWVHHHLIRFQLIFCAAGWVEVVYEDQGDPFRMEAGDCVLQPPGIRHRVLRASPGLEVIEIGCPAVHDTFADHELELPNGRGDADRSFGGQRFVRHVAAGASSSPWLLDGLVARDTGIAAATGGLATAVVVQAAGNVGARTGRLVHDGEFSMFVVVAGETGMRVAARTTRLGRGDAVAVPPDTPWSWEDWSDDVEVLVVALPAAGIRAVDLDRMPR